MSELPMLLHARADFVEAARKRAERTESESAYTTLLFAMARGLEGLLRASAIEARRAETLGSVEDESATEQSEGTPK